eukprot:2759456-Prymnesium_polylepis.1
MDVSAARNSGSMFAGQKGCLAARIRTHEYNWAVCIQLNSSKAVFVPSLSLALLPIADVPQPRVGHEVSFLRFA